MYDEGIYDDLPEYKWDASFDANDFAESIDYYNDQLFGWLREIICNKLDIPRRTTGCMFSLSLSLS